MLAGPAYLTRCLQALLFQTNVQDIEIIVPCDERISDVPVLQKKFPAVWFLTIGGHRTFAELRALGVGKARGAIIALTEDHCTPNPDWCDRILHVHAAPHAAVGGAVEKVAPDTPLNWALYLADYGRYMNPRAEGLSSELTDCNVSYKSAALHAIADVWQSEFHEPAVHDALRKRGEALWFSPNIIVQQQRSMSLREAIRDRYIFGRLFGSGRAIAAPVLRRLFYAALGILLPALLTGRVAQQVFRRRRHIGAFLSSLPALIVLNLAWAWGEFLGYLTARAEISLKPSRSTESRPQESSAA
jgi:hypothetical protein